MNTTPNIAPGQPGAAPRWTSSAKEGVGTAFETQSPLWFTLHAGIVTETYYPAIDRACLKDFGLLVTDGGDFFSEEKRDTRQEIEPLAPGVPGWRLTNTCKEGRYRIVKTILTDPQQPVLLTQVRFEPLQGSLSDYRLYALLAPHLGDHGGDNTAWLESEQEHPLLLAKRDGLALALACSSPFVARSCGYVGVSDGWQELHRHKRFTVCYDSAPDGNVALTGEIDPAACGGNCVLAVGFGANAAEASGRALAGLHQDFEQATRAYVQGWQQYQSSCRDLGGADSGDFARMSVAVLKAHDAKQRPGGMIASLSVPWGFARGDKDLGGYHVIWPRDQVEGAGALLAAGDGESARQTLDFLMHTQQEDGHWPQNMWLDGSPYWNGLQLDETALPILLADSLKRRGELGETDPQPTVRNAAEFLQTHGPSSPMDRWEENAGFSPFTLAVLIAALLAAADFAESGGEKDRAEQLRRTADEWNGRIEEWTYVTGTDLAKRHEVEGYYVRIAPPDVTDQGGPGQAEITLKNREPGQERFPAAEIVSPDALALVRYGLRAPDDPRIRNTVKVLDATLRTETATGPVWHRYTHDGYGETKDGRPFRGVGVGGGWPLLTGERAHYEMALGNKAEAERLLHVLRRQTSPGGMLPEQVWDRGDLPARGLFNGHPAGSGMPLVWAHAEAVKLMRSLRDETVWDTPPQTVERYLEGEKS